MSRLLLDTVERTVGTYAVAFLGLLIGDKTTVGWVAKNRA